VIPFQISLSLSVLAVAVALFRMRPCLFMLAANQAVVTKAFINIVNNGQPASQAFLPAQVYSIQHIATASHICMFATSVVLVLVLLPGRRRQQPTPRLAELPRPLLVLMAAYFVVLSFATKTIFQGEWTDNTRQVFTFDLGGLHVLIIGLLLYVLTGRIRRRQISSFAALLLVFVTCLFTDFLKGTTGIAAGTVSTAAFVFLGEGSGAPRRRMYLAGALLGVFIVAATIRAVRSTIYYEGTASVASFVNQFVPTDSERLAPEQGVEDTANGTQYAAHMLECITLWEQGISREWRSIYLPLEYTVKPSFLLGPLGLTRSREAAWELGDYFVHGGGIYTLGEYYWNGGPLCLVVVFVSLGLFLFLCDTRYRSSPAWLVMLLGFAPNFMMGQGYGFAQVARGIFNGFWLLLALTVLQYFRARVGQNNMAPPKQAAPA
jgi:hypothetical protein